MVFQPSDRSAARWNTHFRFALTTGLRFSAHSNENTTTQKGDISNELTMGTFLKSFDIQTRFILLVRAFRRIISHRKERPICETSLCLELSLCSAFTSFTLTHQ